MFFKYTNINIHLLYCPNLKQTIEAVECQNKYVIETPDKTTS